MRPIASQASFVQRVSAGTFSHMIMEMEVAGRQRAVRTACMGIWYACARVSDNMERSARIMASEHVRLA